MDNTWSGLKVKTGMRHGQWGETKERKSLQFQKNGAKCKISKLLLGSEYTKVNNV